jgi:hypothetical protein
MDGSKDIQDKIQSAFNFSSSFNYVLLGFNTFELSYFCHAKWLPVTVAWRVLRLLMKGKRQDVEDSCRYMESAVVDSQQVLTFQLDSWARG